MQYEVLTEIRKIRSLRKSDAAEQQASHPETASQKFAA
jgi:hypothetical protein